MIEKIKICLHDHRMHDESSLGIFSAFFFRKIHGPIKCNRPFYCTDVKNKIFRNQNKSLQDVIIYL